MATFSKHNLMVVIPALNEARTIAGVVQDVRRHVGCEVVVVDDASTDNTMEVARRAGAQVLPHTLQLGAWGAIQTGLRYARQKGCRMAVTMDADGQHRADYIPILIESLMTVRADVVIGAFTQRGSLARRLAWYFFRQFTRLKIQDLTSGFRIYNAHAISRLLGIETSLLDYQDIGVLLYLRRSGLKVQEVPVLMARRESGASRVFSSWATVCGYLLTTWLLCVSKSDVPFSK